MQLLTPADCILLSYNECMGYVSSMNGIVSYRNIFAELHYLPCLPCSLQLSANRMYLLKQHCVDSMAASSTTKTFLKLLKEGPLKSGEDARLWILTGAI